MVVNLVKNKYKNKNKNKYNNTKHNGSILENEGVNNHPEDNTFKLTNAKFEFQL